MQALPARNVSLAVIQSTQGERHDEDNTGTLHARIQARSGSAGRGRPEPSLGASTLGLVEQTLFNWVKVSRQGRLNGADSKPVSAKQMEIARLRTELARVKMERDILGKGESAGRASSEWPADERVLRQGSEHCSDK